MFVDQVEIDVSAGKGGNGAVTFRREKFVPHGGPDGGDGGRGGDIIFQIDINLSTLLDFRYKKAYKAQNGQPGASKNMYGKDGEDLVLSLPPGTVVYNRETNEIIADLSEDNPRVIIAKGGVGGRGNAQFTTSVQQAPKFGEMGEPGQSHPLRLELKLLADVGLLGYPNVGKSTLISAVSAAKPKIADYPFTTIIPNLGVVYVDNQKSFVMADLPGLIEGAHEGVGLGIQFLRHVERTRVLVHLLDVSGLTGRNPMDDFRVINKELELYGEHLAELPQLVALNKMDLADAEFVREIEEELRGLGHRVFRISAATRLGLQELIYAVWELIEAARLREPVVRQGSQVSIKAERQEDRRAWTIVPGAEPGVWEVQGIALSRTVSMTDLDNEHAVRRLQKLLDKMGVYKKLETLGAKEGDTVKIGLAEFEYSDDNAEASVS